MVKQFKYYFEGTQIDFFSGAMTKEQLIESLEKDYISSSSESIIEDNYSFVYEKVLEISKEQPHTIRYFSIPRYGYGDMEICALAKVHNDGSTYMFTNDKNIAKFISIMSGYDFEICTLD